MTLMDTMRATILGFALVMGLTATARAQDAPRRIVSLNLCADQLLLALADPERIVALGAMARDRTYSYLAERADAVPQLRGGAEDILTRDADLVFVGPYDNRYTRAALAERGLRMEIVEPWTSLDQGKAQIRRIAGLVGRPERGEALVGEIDGALARLPRVRPGTTALELERRGWVPGSATLVHDLLRRMGFTDAAEALGMAGGGFVSLEKLVATKPHMAVLDHEVPAAEDQGTAWLRHPALSGALPPDRRLYAPSRLSICGGPSTPELIDALGDQVRRSGLAVR